MEYILFSCVSDVDPVGRDNYDGALLHTVRVYKPKTVYIFFTRRFLEISQKYDNLYENCIKEICPDCEVISIVDHLDIEVQNFDSNFQKYCQEKFKEIVNKHFCYRDGRAENTLLVNVTSGTPQMQMALGFSIVFMPKNYAIEPVQTQRREKERKSEDQEKKMPIVSEDNKIGFDDRTVKPKFRNVSFEVNKRYLMELVREYNFESAYSYAKMAFLEEGQQGQKKERELILLYLKELVCRRNINLSEVNSIKKDIAKLEEKKVQQSSSPSKEYDLLLAHIESMLIKKQNKDIHGFYMLFGVVFVHLTVYYIKQTFGIDIPDNAWGVECSLKKQAPDIYESLLKLSPKNQNYDFRRNAPLFSDVLNALHSQALQFEPSGKRKYEAVLLQWKEVREVEKEIRNILAHQLSEGTKKAAGQMDAASPLLVKYAKTVLDFEENHDFLETVKARKELFKNTIENM